MWLFGIALGACRSAPEPHVSAFSIDFERYALSNGLDVVLHVDDSDPVVAVAVTYHVGSAREEPARTGLAHLFEHLLFLDSENLGPGGLDILIDKVGGTLNGFTDRDRTTYYEVVPNDALEKILWAEADKLGYFINTVSPAVLAKEREVVKNEKRQNYDNRPYGHTATVIGENLYPEGHPYSWQVIGSLEDLDRVTLQDVRRYHASWYAPNNATLVLAGDFQPDQARAWIEKYFGEIPSRPLPATASPAPVRLAASRRLFHEDPLVTLPELTLTWPTVPLYHPDAYPLELLAALLSQGKSAPLYEVIVAEETLAPSVDVYTYTSELAGEMTLAVRGHAGSDLDAIDQAIARAFHRFEEGVAAKDLDRLKAGYEIDFYTGYRGISSVLGKAFKLSEYSVLAGDPGYLARDMARLAAVTESDVLRVYRNYIRSRPFVATSFVPEGREDLALDGSVRARIRAEEVGESPDSALAGASGSPPLSTPSSLDRSVEPPFGAAPSLSVPEIWTASPGNGIRVYGIEDRELPVVRLTIRLEGGLLLDDPTRVGVANLTAALMNAGTRDRTPEELEAAIELLGSSVSIVAGREELTVSVSALRRNFSSTMEIVQEMLLEPRWDPSEFVLAKQRILSTLQRQATSPDAIADRVFSRLVYGSQDILSETLLGTVDSVQSITLAHLESYYARNISPETASVHVVGDISQAEVVGSMTQLLEEWPRRTVAVPDYPLPPPIDRAGLYFVDVPDATQSVVRIGALSLAETDMDFYPATIMNLRLGGAFVSDLVQVLREQRGYTYGVNSAFSGSRLRGPFRIRTNVRSAVTLESVQFIRDILESYPTTFGAEDLEAARSFLVRSNARMLETLNAKIDMLEKIGALDLPFDYLRERERIVNEIGLERIRDLATRYADPDRMVYLVVGDARTQLPRLAALGLGPAVLLDAEGVPVSTAVEPAGGGFAPNQGNRSSLSSP